MFQRDKSDRLAYRFVDHVRARRDDATGGPRRARDARDANVRVNAVKIPRA